MAAGMETWKDRPGTRATASRRRFRLLDAMILVAATAAGCGVTRWIGQTTEGEISWSYLAQFWASIDPTPAREEGPAVVPGWTDLLIHSGLIVAELTMPIVAAWTLALIPIRWLGPRPRLRRLARQPGMIAMCASGLAMIFVGLLVSVATLAYGRSELGGEVSEVSDLLDVEEILVIVPVFLGLAVVASWMTLLMGRRWRAEPSWIDRLGRALGVFWIVAGFAVTGLWIHELSTHECHFYVRQISPQ